MAIYRYLARKYSVPDYLYPKDVQKQARVDEYLEWQHLNTRYVFQSFVNLLFQEKYVSS